VMEISAPHTEQKTETIPSPINGLGRMQNCFNTVKNDMKSNTDF
jgi:hypothetical protein